MEILMIKSNNGFYIKESGLESYQKSNLGRLFVNGMNPSPTFSENWFKVLSEPYEITKKVDQPHINHRYILINPDMETKTIKPCFMRDEVAEYDETEYVWLWKDEYCTLQSLYRLESDPQPPIFEPVEFKLIKILEIDEIKEFPISYQILKDSRWGHKGVKNLTEKSIKYQELDRILFPEIVLPQKPCELSSKDSYEIIRQHVKNNIDPRYAEITSDYGFCFTVKKKIPLSEPEKYTIDVNFNLFAKRKKKPKYAERYRKDRLVEIFEMTNKSDNYKDYTPIDGFRGKNHEDLKKNIDTYLSALMEVINKPLVDCPHCKGKGVILD